MQQGRSLPKVTLQFAGPVALDATLASKQAAQVTASIFNLKLQPTTAREYITVITCMCLSNQIQMYNQTALNYADSPLLPVSVCGLAL